MDGWMDDEVRGREGRKKAEEDWKEGEIVIEELAREGLQSNVFFTHPNLDMLIPPSHIAPDCLYRYDYMIISYTRRFL